MSDEHSSLIKTPKQLIIVVLAAFIIPICLIIMIATLATFHSKSVEEESEDVVSRRIRPVGELNIVDVSAPRVLQSGQQVFQGTCTTCHSAGVAGAPKVGDKAAWSPLIKQGYDTLLQHALNGNQRNGAVMPAKGGNTDLDDLEVGRAIVYMANQAGAGFKEPQAGTPSKGSAAATPAGSVATPAASGATQAPGTAGKVASGKSTFDSVCVVCHGTGVAGAPKTGDKVAWAPRIKTGLPALYQSALNGKNAMPAKGGNASLSDNDVKAAVDYMVGLAK